MKTQQTAIEKYMSLHAEIVEKLAALQEIAEDHFGDDSDSINWGHVGNLERIRDTLDYALEVSAQ